MRDSFSSNSVVLSALWSKKDVVIFKLPKPGLLPSFLIVLIIFSALVLPVLAVAYNPGVKTGQFVKYGNFVSTGPGLESFNDYDWLKLEVISVSGQSVTLLSTGQFKNGTALLGNGTIDVWNVAAGTDNGTLKTQGYIIAANLNQGSAIPPSNTFIVNSTLDRTYLGVSRRVNVLSVTVSTPDYNSTLNYFYDKISGMLLESSSETTAQAQPEPVSTYSYSVIETNIFSSTNIPEFSSQILLFILVTVMITATSAIVALRSSHKPES